MNKKLIAMALLAFSVPVAANAAWNFTTWAKSAGGTISSRNNAAQTNLNNKIFKSYTTHESLPVTVTAATGYTISSISLNGLPVAISPLETALMISGGAGANVAQSLYATFAAAILPVTASAGANGTVSPASVSNIRYGTTTAPIVFSFTPETGYKVIGITGADSFTVSPAVASAVVNQTVKVTIPTGTALTAAVNLSGTFAGAALSANAGPTQTVLTNTPVTLTGTGNGTSVEWSMTSSPASPAAFAAGGPSTRVYTPTKAGTYTFMYRTAADNTFVPNASSTTTLIVTASLGVTATGQCMNCHNDTGVGLAANVGGYLNSAHAAKNILCSQCHVGADQGAHPGTVAANICTSCHGVTAPAPPATANHSTSDTCYSCHKHNATSNVATKPLDISNVTMGVNGTGFITATFNAKTGTTPVTGLTAAVTSISLVGLVPGAANASDEWVSWGSTTDALVETPAASGTYVLTTNKTLANAPATATGAQRAMIRFNNGATFQQPVAVSDFSRVDASPVASGKEVVNDNSCKECHGFGVTIHSFGRNNTQACVVCHNLSYTANAYDMVTMAHQIHNGDGATKGAKAVISGNKNWADHGDGWGITNTTDPTILPAKKFVYPGTMLDCANCHNSVAQADNWKTKPTMAACKSCHGTITFDGTAFVGLKTAVGTLHTATDNSSCVGCHDAAYVAAKHPVAIAKKAELRTIETTVTGAAVNPATGAVTVNFSVANAGVPVTNLTAASFTLTKLIPAVPAENKPSSWISYLSSLKSKNDSIAPKQNFAPVVQGRTEAKTATVTPAGAVFTNIGGGAYSYQFALLNAEPAGDIRNVVKSLNTNTFNATTFPTPYDKVALPSMVYPVAYDANALHRIGVSVANAKADASIDFVPSGSAATETRNIVAWGENGKSCNSCHGSSRIHAGNNNLNYCVGCHNANTFDPFSGPTDIAVPAITDAAFTGSKSVSLETIVHKIHMGRLLPSVIAGGEYTINTEPGGTSHVYTKSQYPGGVPQLTTDSTKTITRASAGRPSDCTKCHDEAAPGMNNAANWKIAGPACFSCHDTMEATNHNKGAVCTSCHNGQDVIDFHFGK